MDRIAKALRQAKDEKLTTPSASVSPIRAVRSVAPPDLNAVAKRIQTSPEELRSNLLLSHIEDKRAIDSYKLLRTRVLRAMQKNQWSTLGVTSTAPNAGKTLTCINLAISISMKQDVEVLLVDADLRIPSVGEIYGIEIDKELHDYINGGAELKDVIYAYPTTKNLFVVPCRPRQDDSSELLGSQAIQRLIQEFKAIYPNGVVLFDLPPVLVGDDVMAAAGNIDSLVVVVEDGETKSDELLKCMEMLSEFNILGTVLNKSIDAGGQSNYYYYYSSNGEN